MPSRMDLFLKRRNNGTESFFQNGEYCKDQKKEDGSYAPCMLVYENAETNWITDMFRKVHDGQDENIEPVNILHARLA